MSQEGDKDDATRRYLLRRFWQSASDFWGQGGGYTAWLLTGALFVLLFVQLGLQYGINVWNRTMFDALEQKNSGAVFHQSLIFPVLAVSIVVVGIALVYVRMTTQRRWRRWLTNQIIDRWLAEGRYYQLNLVKGDHQNPEYRIAEDLRVATESPIDFATGILAASFSAITFIFVLWTIGGSLSFHVGSSLVTIPAFLVVAAILYAVLASGSMIVIGRRFVTVAERKNQAEAEYRYALTRVRENGESIALLGGEEEERAGLDKSLHEVLRRWRDICLQHMRTSVVSLGSAVLAPVVPLILTAPKYVDGSMSLGQVMQAASAFVTVQGAFNWLVENYPRFADWTASTRRVASLLVSLDNLERCALGDCAPQIDRRYVKGAALRLRNLSITLDDGTAVVNEAEVSIAPGEKVLVAGESGTGKSTLVRAISGLWPWGEGEIAIQDGARLFMLPQRPYVPIGSLKRAATYPRPAEEVSDEEVGKTLKLVGLGHLVERMHEEGPWDQTLSGGEKQRLAFARLLIHRPDIIVLDEATSALDPKSQEQLMRLISERLEATTIISVGHRPELEDFHFRKLVLEGREDGARLISDEDLMPKIEPRARGGWSAIFGSKPAAEEQSRESGRSG